MDLKTRKMKSMNKKLRCEYSGKVVGNREVVLVKYARDYLIKCGYLVSKARFLISFLFITLIALSMLPYGSSGEYDYLEEGLVGWWTFDTADISGSTAIDSVGWFPINGSIVSAVAETGATACISGQCLYFDGDNDYVDFGTDSSLRVGKNFSVSVWALTSSAYSGREIMSRWDNGNSRDWVIWNNDGIGNPGNYIGAVFNKYSSPTYSNVLSDSTAQDGVWHHIVFVHNDTGGELWVDGSMVDSVTNTEGLKYDNARNTTLGDKKRLDGVDFKGYADEVAIYNVSLNSSKISALFENNITFSDITEDPASPDYDPVITLVSPVNDLYSVINHASFNSTFTDDFQLANISYYLWDSGGNVINNTSYSLSGTAGGTNNTHYFPDFGTYTWNYYVYDNASQVDYEANRTLIYYNASASRLPTYHWTFNDSSVINQTDYVTGLVLEGHNFTGVPSNDYVNGHIDDGLNFSYNNDVDHKFLWTEDSTFHSVLDQNFSISFWFQPKNVIDKYSIIANNHGATHNGGIEFFMDTGADAGKMFLYTADGGWTKVWTDVLNVNEWYHVAATFNATGASLFLNGEFVVRNSRKALESDETYFVVGCGGNTPPQCASNYHARMNFDELKVWDSTLTEEEVLYDSSINGNITYYDPVISGLWESYDDPILASLFEELYINVTVTDDDSNLDTVFIEFDGVNYSVNNVGDIYYFNVTNLSSGVYDYYWFANDSIANFSILSSSFTVQAVSDDDTVWWEFDTTSNLYIFILALIMLVAVFFFYIGVFYAAGSVVTFFGFLLLFNDINVLISAFFILLGVVVVFIRK